MSKDCHRVLVVLEPYLELSLYGAAFLVCVPGRIKDGLLDPVLWQGSSRRQLFLQWRRKPGFRPWMEELYFVVGGRHFGADTEVLVFYSGLVCFRKGGCMFFGV